MTFPLLGGVFQSATILFFRVVLNHNANAWRPINPDLTSFHRPMNITEKSTLSYDNSDPIGRAMYMLYFAFVRWPCDGAGWSVQSVTDQQVCAYANALTTKPADSNGYIKVQRHRSTALALLPAQFLAGRIEVSPNTDHNIAAEQFDAQGRSCFLSPILTPKNSTSHCHRKSCLRAFRRRSSGPGMEIKWVSVVLDHFRTLHQQTGIEFVFDGCSRVRHVRLFIWNRAQCWLGRIPLGKTGKT